MRLLSLLAVLAVSVPEEGVEVWLGDELAVTYRARIEGKWLVVEATHEPGWHTYAMDNVRRAREASGKDAPETELPTVITPSDGLVLTGDWRQSRPVDLSQPDIRWFTWGFEDKAFFAARLISAEPSGWVRINGQACTAERCAMVDGLEVPVKSGRERSVDPESLTTVPPSQ